ncbi:A/G-specific adenine glycosylase [Corynebacterium sp. 335C]
MAAHAPARPTPDRLHRRVVGWYQRNARPLPWRAPGTTAWGVLVSEVMSQQTPVARVAPRWEEWMERWPEPADLAAAPKSEVLRAWGKLGYPRRALRLAEAAAAIAERHGGEVPDDVDELLALPGIGDYTARAVAAFHYGRPVPVVDVNVRRVLRRHRQGSFLPGVARRADMDAVAELLPDDGVEGDGAAAEFGVGLMELGALVCTARSPECGACPVADDCEWVLAGSPAPDEEELAAARRRVQRFEGTDRQCRGRLLDVLRGASAPVPQARLDEAWPDAPQRARCLFSLLEDGLAEQDDDGLFRLPE